VKLTVNLFGWLEIVNVTVDLPENQPDAVTVVDKAAKGLSRWFMDRLAR
jgi:hypothetical protein